MVEIRVVFSTGRLTVTNPRKKESREYYLELVSVGCGLKSSHVASVERYEARLYGS